MTLDAASVEWAIDFIDQHSDGDLFPKLPESRAISECKAKFAAEVAGKALRGSFRPRACRRFIVPKDEVSYRQATQLHPQDSVLLTACMYQFGAGIEARRLPADRVFSYRFDPKAPEGLYGGHAAWNDYWALAENKSKSSGCILQCDIADFYNQIYHHVVENQLIESGLNNQALKWIIELLESTTQGVSRGVPIGPHAIHLIAEATLIPVDNSLVQQGIDFIRYADDFLIFCSDKREARGILQKFASILDRQQRLMLQRHKTRFLTSDELVGLAESMVQDRPINPTEAGMLKVIKAHSSGNPYAFITYNQISDEDWRSFSDASVRSVIEDYLARRDVDYIRLRWFYRRLAQVGHPGAIEVTLDRLQELTPCMASICGYLSSVQEMPTEQWLALGRRLLDVLKEPEVGENEYFRLSILSLFARNSQINHFADLVRSYHSGDPFVRREVILAAAASGSVDWLREQKEHFPQMDEWQSMAFIFASSGFPADERKYFLGRQELRFLYETTLAAWSKAGGN